MVRVEADKENEQKKMIMAAFHNPNARVGINYFMAIAGQPGGRGHIAPLVASHKEMDAFLIMDCWPDKGFGPCWVAWDNLWKAMLDKDKESDQSRGFIIVTKTKN